MIIGVKLQRILLAVGTSRGILLAWDSIEIRKVDEWIRSYSVSIKVVELSSRFEWVLTGVYGPCKPHLRSEFWNELISIKLRWGGPRVVGGDFNVIRFTYKKNRPSCITCSMRDFNQWVNQCDLRDSPLLNAKYTWSDGKEFPLLSRLDRFMVSNCWEEVYPYFTLEVIPKITSDHWILLNTFKINYSLILFRFENMWVTHPQFKDCIRKWWNEHEVEGYKGFQFMKKFHYVKQKLRVWNKNKFGRIKEKKIISRRRWNSLTRRSSGLTT